MLSLLIVFPAADVTHMTLFDSSLRQVVKQMKEHMHQQMAQCWQNQEILHCLQGLPRSLKAICCSFCAFLLDQ